MIQTALQEMLFTSFRVKCVASSVEKNEHSQKFNIINFNDPDYSTQNATHFNTDEHSLGAYRHCSGRCGTAVK